MQRIHFYLFSLIFVLLTACNTTRNIPSATIEFDEELLDTLTVTASKADPSDYQLSRYNPAAERAIDLKHMDLAVSFDWENEQVNGDVKITWSPYFYPTNIVELDAVKMKFSSVSLANSSEQLPFENTGEKLIVTLDRTYTRNENIVLSIKYIANPSLGAPQIAGYNPSDQGLYFINSDGSDPIKPMQIWSQGETEYNSHWFPTVDKPNERYTHDLHITVQDKYATLSNGYVVSSKKENGMRTDHWRMDEEHAPYLTMITVGEFAVVKDVWKDVPLMYYVEEDYEAYAQKIFNHTPEMLEYFSKLTGVEYPWDTYSQVVIRDFVAGAMENTTAVTFGEFVQKTDRELIDNHNDDIVAHEMFHHWFGDYVTCESWANLTLNEGFANYSEYLWTQHKYGQATADNKRLNELAGYMYQATNQGTHPLIHYSYQDKEQMFDAHSYNKGGLVLHMLRHELGDEAFFASLTKYLKDNAGSAVEVDELRMAFEETTGKDLQVFFNQWYLESGHPILEIAYDRSSPSLSVSVKQVQSPERSIPIFQLPLHFDLYMKNGDITRISTTMNEREQQYEFAEFSNADIDWINFDPDHVLLGEWQENREMNSYLKEYKQSSSQYDKREAMEALKTEKVMNSFYEEILTSEDNYVNKYIATGRIPYNKEILLSALEKADNVHLKNRILSLFEDRSNDIDEKTLTQLLDSERSWRVIAPAIKLLGIKNSARTVKYIDQYKDENNEQLVFNISQALLATKQVDRSSYILQKLPFLSSYVVPRIIGTYFKLIESANNEQAAEIVQDIRKNVIDNELINSASRDSFIEALNNYIDSLSGEKKKLFEGLMK